MYFYLIQSSILSYR